VESATVSQLRPGDAIYFSALGWNPRRRIVTDLKPSDGKIELSLKDAGVAFVRPEQVVQVFEDTESLACSKCERVTVHSLGICDNCGEEYSGKTNSKVEEVPKVSSRPSTPLPPPPQRGPIYSYERSSQYSFERLSQKVDSGDIAGLIATTIGTVATIGGVVQVALAFWLYHLTDTGRIDGLDSALRALEAESGTTLQNEFHVIALGIGISGILFAALGIGLLTTFWFADKSR
jgi:hypothetical protein